MAEIRKFSYAEPPPISIPMSPKKTLVLSTGHDPMLLNSRRLVLEHAGFDVVSCSVEHALGELRQRPTDFDAAVLGQSIQLSERLSMAREMRGIAPGIAIVFMHFPEDRFDASICDAVVETLSEPEVLARAVRRALKKRGKS